MDYKDILAVVIVIIFVLVAEKVFPNNPLSTLGNYIKNLFIRRS